MVTLVAELPIEQLQLGGVLQVLRARPSLVRVVVMQLARKPRSLIEQVRDAKLRASGDESDDKHSSDAADADDDDSPVLEMDAPDPFAFVDLLHDATNGEVSGADFVPASLGRCLEPLLNLMGHGFFFIRPSPYCALATCLVSGGPHQSVPVTRLFDVLRFYDETKSLLPRLQDGKVGMLNGMRLRSALKSCLRTDEAQISDIWPYLVDKSKANATQSFIDHAQFFIVHNHMDIASFDALRRCQCASIAIDEKKGYVATCANCL